MATIRVELTVSDQDDLADTVEEFQEAFGLWIMDHPEWQPTNVYVVESE